MATQTQTFEVDADPARAWAYLADHRHAVDWDPTVVASTLVGDEPIEAGSAFDATVTFYGRRLDLRYLLVEHDRPTRLAFELSGSKVVGTMTFDLTPNGSGTRIDHRIDLALTGMLRMLGKGLGAALEGIGEKAADGIRRSLAD